MNHSSASRPVISRRLAAAVVYRNPSTVNGTANRYPKHAIWFGSHRLLSQVTLDSSDPCATFSRLHDSGANGADWIGWEPSSDATPEAESTELTSRSLRRRTLARYDGRSEGRAELTATRRT